MRRVADPQQTIRARGEPMLWLCGGALATCLLMVAGLLLFVGWNGGATFWPRPLMAVALRDGSTLLGEVTRDDTYTPSAERLAELPDEWRTAATVAVQSRGGTAHRRLLRTGNTGDHFRWVDDFAVTAETRPELAVVIDRRASVEREAWGKWYGYLDALLLDGEPVATTPRDALARIAKEHPAAMQRNERIESLREHAIGRLADAEEEARLAIRRADLRHGANSPQHGLAQAAFDALRVEQVQARKAIDTELTALRTENERWQLRLRNADGRTEKLHLADVVRIHAPNDLSLAGQLSVYADRWWEFLTAAPRETNQEGGVWPAIFCTVLMTLLMSLLVVPFGVLAALYIREYAKAGILISAVRVAVNNLAGVPSIVFGVFGLGFFCYIIGGSIDSLFYPERLPNPTFGTGALIWASLTLALLTLPVVIVSTEEALAAVPSSMREGSYACGASKWQTIRRIVLPRAMPGLMTGVILAMARGAGEVAPLMLVGAVKLAPRLPFDGDAPFFHPSRSFMHLGFHIYDLGFQSQNSEANKPMVFTTTLLLIGVVLFLNVTAVWLRSRLRRRFVGAQF
ncbi:MAG: phosphate ABC transporter permease PstA [Planctomycetes bacterium]|nr:phosphate ABC transporter permease PstA [Planctomycetota bacterium]